MVKLKTVKQVKDFLSNFNDNCEVKINVNGTVHNIEGYGWIYGDGGDCDMSGITIEQRMAGANELHLEVNCTHEKQS